MKAAVLISGIVLVGCAGGEPDQRGTPPAPVSPEPPSVIVDDFWVPDQGTHILGAKADAITEPLGAAYLSVSTTPLFRTAYTLSLPSADQGAYLIAKSSSDTKSGTDTWFNGLILRASDGGQIKILGSQTMTADTLGFTGVANSTLESTEYLLKYRPAGGGPNDWRDYCDDPEHGAVPVLGRYAKDRTHMDATASISFACNWGISYKCTMWGFGAGNRPGDDRWTLHDACEGAGNARYCGDAHSYTREMTPVWFVDNSTATDVGLDQSTLPYTLTHPTPWPGDPDTLYIESAWRDDGTPYCISKLRWVSLPPRPCEGVIRDPRFSPHDDHEVFFCDQFTVEQLLATPHVRLVNGSKMMDAPLTRWSNGKETVSTIYGVWIDADGDGRPDDDTVYPPLTDASGKQTYRGYLGSDGMLLRNLTGTLEAAKMTLLHMQIDGNGDHYLSDGATDPSAPDFEGYALPTQSIVDSEYETIIGQPLYQCDWAANDHDTHLGNAPLRGCAQGRRLGFAFSAP